MFIVEESESVTYKYYLSQLEKSIKVSYLSALSAVFLFRVVDVSCKYLRSIPRYRFLFRPFKLPERFMF